MAHNNEIRRPLIGVEWLQEQGVLDLITGEIINSVFPPHAQEPQDVLLGAQSTYPFTVAGLKELGITSQAIDQVLSKWFSTEYVEWQARAEEVESDLLFLPEVPREPTPTLPNLGTPNPTPQQPWLPDQDLEVPNGFDSLSTAPHSRRRIGLAEREVLDQVMDSINSAVMKTIQELDQKWTLQETVFTDALVTRIKDSVAIQSSQKVRWYAEITFNSGRGSIEQITGADFGVVLDIQFTRLRLVTAVLVQAKRLDPGVRMKKKEHARLRGQCSVMLHHTPAAYVFLYSTKGIQVVPALAAATFTERCPYELSTIPVSRFFENFLSGFIGDHKLVAKDLWMGSNAQLAADRDALKLICDRLAARELLYLGMQARAVEEQKNVRIKA